MTPKTEPDQHQNNDGATELFLRNSAANIVIGASTAILALGVPPVLVRTLSATEFAVWALVLQIAGYTGLLNLGLQDAVGRYVAFHEERREIAARDEFVNTSLWVLCLMAILAIIGLGAVALFLDTLFPRIPPDLMTIARGLLLASGVTLACGLPFSVFNGILVGLRRNGVVAGIVGTGRIVLAGLLSVVAWMSHSLYWLTVCFIAVNAASYGALWLCCRRLTTISVIIRMPKWVTLREIWSYCGTVTLWQISMLMISGLDVIILGRVDFPSLPYYTVCLAPISVLIGLMPALFNPLLQIGAIYTARGQELELTKLLERSTRLATVVLMLVALPLIVFDREILTAWVGPAYAIKALPILWLVVVGHAFRQLAYPYSTLLLATKRHNQLLLSPLVEGCANLLVAIVAGSLFGVMGVATAVVVGAIVGQLMNYYYNLPRTHGRAFDRAAFVRRSVLRPGVCFAPLAVLALTRALELPEYLSVGFRLVLFLVCFALIWRFALDGDERDTFLRLLGRGRLALRRAAR